MTIALVVSVSVLGTANGPTDTPATDTTGATGLVAGKVYFTEPTVSDSKGNVWTARTAATNGGNDVAKIVDSVSGPTVGTGHVCSTSSTSNQFAPLMMLAFSGMGSGAFDQQATGDAALNTGNLTPSEDNEVIVEATGWHGGDVTAIASPFTLQEHQPLTGGVSWGGAMAYSIQTTATERHPVWTGMAAGSCVAASYKAAAAGGSFQSAWTRGSNIVLKRAA